MTMGIDIHLDSVFRPWMEEFMKEVEAHPREDLDPIERVTLMYRVMEGSGAYFRNGRNHTDLMWAIGSSWEDKLYLVLDHGYLPIRKAQELIDFIDSRPITHDLVKKHHQENITGDMGCTHPAQIMFRKIGVPKSGRRYPTADELYEILNYKRDLLLDLLRRSIELGEPLSCS